MSTTTDPGPLPAGGVLDAARLVSTDELLDQVWCALEIVHLAAHAGPVAPVDAEQLVDLVLRLDGRLRAGDPLPRVWRTARRGWAR